MARHALPCPETGHYVRMKKLLNYQYMIKTSVILTICCLFFTFIFLSDIVSAVSVPAGEPAPDFTLPSLDGSPVSLSDYKGSIVVLLYFRSDQKRSIMALEELNTIRAKYADKDLHFIAISAETEGSDEILPKMKEAGIDFPVLMDRDRDVYGSYGIRVYPSTIIIDKEHKIAASIPGHALSYKVRLDGTLQFIRGEIDEAQLKAIISPEKKTIDVEAIKAERKYNLALKFTKESLLYQAIEFAKQAIEAKPDIAKSHILLGYLYLDDRESEKAVEQFEKAANIDPSSNDTLTGLGAALIEIGDIDRAVEVLNKALLQNPNPQRTFYELGRAYELKGDNENAAAMYKKSIDKMMDEHVLPSSVVHCR
jgi:tetratricopeptide (TPR) repeat protein